MAKFNEDTLSEKPAIEQLVRMGYTFVPGAQLDQNLERIKLALMRVLLTGKIRVYQEAQ